MNTIEGETFVSQRVSAAVPHDRLIALVHAVAPSHVAPLPPPSNWLLVSPISTPEVLLVTCGSAMGHETHRAELDQCVLLHTCQHSASRVVRGLVQLPAGAVLLPPHTEISIEHR